MSHLNETGYNYFHHLFRAWRLSFILFVHGILPEVWKTKASDELCKQKVADDATRAYMLKTMYNIDERPFPEREERPSVWTHLSDRELAARIELGNIRRAEAAKKESKLKKNKNKK